MKNSKVFSKINIHKAFYQIYKGLLAVSNQGVDSMEDTVKRIAQFFDNEKNFVNSIVAQKLSKDEDQPNQFSKLDTKLDNLTLAINKLAERGSSSLIDQIFSQIFPDNDLIKKDLISLGLMNCFLRD